MPKTKISEYSSTANSNTDVASINIDENCAPSGINNAIRAVMGHLKDFQAGTNGDSFNGPVGTGAAAAGAFTTLSASGNVTLGDASSDTLNVGNGGIVKDASGNVGIGTSSPSSKLHVAGTGTQSITVERTDAATAGLFQLISGSSTNVISASTAKPVSVEINGSERMRIDSSGNFLVGKTSASYTTQGCFVDYRGTFNSAAPSGLDFLNCYSTTAGAYRFYVTNAGTVNATSNTISSISDIRFKENVRDLDNGLASVMALKPRLYDWKEGKGANIKNARGFIAQEFEEVFPDLIDEWRESAPEGEEPYKAIRQDLIPVLVKAIQEQQAMIASQSELITTLTERIDALEAK
jgi:hypothetical protein